MAEVNSLKSVPTGFGIYKPQKDVDVWIVVDLNGRQVSPRWMSTEKEARDWSNALMVAYNAGYSAACACR